MRLLAFVGVTATFALAVITSSAAAESTVQRDAPTTRFYDSRGNSTGSATTYGNQIFVYDSRGTHIGTMNSTHTGTAAQKSGR